MKLFPTLLLTMLTSTILNAQTTMCFKENHSSMSTIEDVKLDGGLCQSLKSVKDMHKEGWVTNDIKINNSNYIYIFKKNTLSASDVDMDLLEAKVVKKLQDAAIEKKKIEKMEMKANFLKAGEKLYTKTCKECHGPKGYKKAYNTSRAIADFSLAEFEVTMSGYLNSDKDFDRGRAIIMRPYAIHTTSKELKKIYVYLKNVNNLPIGKVSKDDE